jgi:gluconate 2-dehydrogenase gamma chain
MTRREALKQTMLFTGYALTASTVQAILSGCETERVVNWTPTFFNATQAELVTNMAETILPATRTPGAIELGVPAYIELMVKDTFQPEDQEKFLAGLTLIDERAQKNHSKSFAQCKAKVQAQLLEEVDAEASAEGIARREAADANPELWNEPYFNFFLTFKSLTLVGYYTSSYAGQNILSYDPIPGAYNGCIPLEEVGNSWSL